MQSRRILIVALLSVVSAGAVAQQGGGPFVGTWKGDVPGIGETTLVIASVTLIIEAALGGRYVLRRAGDGLTGRYTRGTTLDVPVTLKKD